MRKRSKNNITKGHYANIKKYDPYFKRETLKYPFPTASREFILSYFEEVGQPVNLPEIIEVFGLSGADDEKRAEALNWRLNAMVRDGQLMCNRRGRYALIREIDLVRGRVVTRRDGSGFVIPNNGGKDIVLTARQMHILFAEDQVLVRVTDEDQRRRYGKVVEVLERSVKEVAGYYMEEKGVGFVAPTSKFIMHEVLVPSENKNGAKSGQLVTAEIISYPTRFCAAIGRIVEILGEERGGQVEIDLALRSYSLPYKWPENVKHELEKIVSTISKTERKKRENLQHLPLVTIDGEDAKDFDDAVYCEKIGKGKKGGWRLYVAIADVGFYVKENTFLDQEASARGNSVYFPRRVIPMLPELLSCDLCSLKPNVERLALVCEIKVKADGNISQFSFYEAIIKSHARLTYNLAHAMLEGKDDSFPELLPHLHELRNLYKVLLAQRKLRGALEFNRMETKVIFDKNNRIKNIVPQPKNYVHEIIEECMLAANVCASKFLLSHKIPALFRVHEGPNPEKLQNLRNFLRNLGLHLGGGKAPVSLDYAKVLHEIAGKKEGILIQALLLRSLSRAVYAAENLGHFGLAYKAYVHFTSPIRRYPDLLNHRAIRYVLKGGAVKEFFYDKHKMQVFGEHCSMTERRADDATEEVVDWLKCQFMLDKVGKVMFGMVSHVTEFGLFIELENYYVEGLLHVTALPNDYYQFDNQHFLLKGKRSGKQYRLSDRIKVKIARVNLDDREIEFVLAE